MLDPYLLYLEKPTPERYDRFVLLYWSPVERLVKRLVASSDLANDVIQETFLRLAKSKKRPDAIENPRAYVLGAAFRLVLEQARKAETRERHESQACRAAPRLHPSTSDIVMARESIERLHAALDSLPPLLRAPMHLRAIEGLSYQEISLITGASVDTVRAQVYRARKRLRAILGKGYLALALMHLSETGHSAVPAGISAALSPRRVTARVALRVGVALLGVCMATLFFFAARKPNAASDSTVTVVERHAESTVPSSPLLAPDRPLPGSDPGANEAAPSDALSQRPQERLATELASEDTLPPIPKATKEILT